MATNLPKETRDSQAGRDQYCTAVVEEYHQSPPTPTYSSRNSVKAFHIHTSSLHSQITITATADHPQTPPELVTRVSYNRSWSAGLIMFRSYRRSGLFSADTDCSSVAYSYLVRVKGGKKRSTGFFIRLDAHRSGNGPAQLLEEGRLDTPAICAQVELLP